MNVDYTFKVIVAGDEQIGKTTLLKRFVEGQFFADIKMTIGVDILRKNMELTNGEICSLQLWDFGGQDQFRFFLDGFVRGANAAFVMFDLTRPNTLLNLEKEWIDIVRKFDKNLSLLLIGTKYDLKELISIKDQTALRVKEKFEMLGYLKTSSKTGFQVQKSFEIITNHLLKNLFHK
ncbi:MAG: Rab family GTPase [Promethearchaeia archaeon]